MNITVSVPLLRGGWKHNSWDLKQSHSIVFNSNNNTFCSSGAEIWSFRNLLNWHHLGCLASGRRLETFIWKLTLQTRSVVFEIRGPLLDRKVLISIGAGGFAPVLGLETYYKHKVSQFWYLFKQVLCWSTPLTCSSLEALMVDPYQRPLYYLFIVK